MSKPIYRAYKPVTETDGITSWIKHWFDPSEVMTPDDKAMRRSILMACAPDARIAEMQENLDSLQNSTSLINLHAKEIREIHAGISNHSHVNGKDFEALHRADELWAHIVILRDMLPNAIRGKKFDKHGRGAGLFRKKIAILLKNNPEMKNPELWAAVTVKLPRGWTACDNRVGKYLEGKNASDSMGYARFCNVCGEERKKLKQ